MVNDNRIREIFDELDLADRLVMRRILNDWWEDSKRDEIRNSISLTRNEIELVCNRSRVSAVLAIRKRLECGLLEAKLATDYYADWNHWSENNVGPWPPLKQWGCV